MEDSDHFIPPQKVSYLQARDPSILSWNRHGIEKVKQNLVNDFESESTISSTPSEKEDNYVKVYLRLKGGANDYEDIYTVEGDNLICRLPDGSYSARNHRDNHGQLKKYNFTHIFGPETGQPELFNEIIKPKILNFINGRNNTLLAYGSSGSGKTFTMVGTVDQPGVIPRALEYLFRTIPILGDKPRVKPLPNGKVVSLNEFEMDIEQQKIQLVLPQAFVEKSVHIKTYKAMQQRLSNEPVATVGHSPEILSVYVSFAEIYNQFVYDLLQPPPQRGQQRPKLKIGGLQDHIYIKGLKYIYVRSGLEAYQVLQYGINNLKYAETALNTHSSRSHCIFTIRLVQGTNFNDCQVSTFNFCDLAGSERLKKTMNIGDRLIESNNINSSLLVLGRCISMIRDGQYGKDNKMPPFRESKLTQLFQRALMGKESIVMIINVNPSADMFDDSQHTLNFAGIAKEIIVEEPPQKILKPNRFSNSFQRTDYLPYVKEDERDEELQELRDQVADLTLALSDYRQNQEDMIEAERRHLRKLYEEIIGIKEFQIKKLEKENKNLVEDIKKRDEVIVLSDDDDSDDDDDETERLRTENLKLKRDIYEVKEDNLKLKREIQRNESIIQQLKHDLANAMDTIADAKSDFQSVVSDNNEYRRQIRDLTAKSITLKDDLDVANTEVEFLRDSTWKDREDMEKLEDEVEILHREKEWWKQRDLTGNDSENIGLLENEIKQVLRESVSNVKTPASPPTQVKPWDTDFPSPFKTENFRI